MKTLIIGAGEIGKSLGKAMVPTHDVWITDKENKPIPYPTDGTGMMSNELKGFDVLNICYPPSKDFVKITKAYIAQYKPKVTIIHSTVAPGTTDKCGRMVVHSPVHGKHPDISGCLKIYTKYIGGKNPFAVDIARDFLKEAGIKVMVVANAKTSELSKILCTTYYGWNIVFMKEVARICEEQGVPFSEVYLNWNFFYNEGNKVVNSEKFNRPVLKPVPGKIGGHCVVENCALLKSDITDFIIKKNDEYKRS